MGTSTFSAAAAVARIQAKVEKGINITAEEIFDLADELVPVRKPGRRKPKTSVIGGFRSQHKIVGGRHPVFLTGGEMYRAYKKSGGTATAAQFREFKVSEMTRSVKAVSAQAYEDLSPAKKRSRRYVIGSERGGTLKKSLYKTEAVNDGGIITAKVGASARYARYVEFPTHRTAAQPFLLPAFKAARNRLKANIKAASGG